MYFKILKTFSTKILSFLIAVTILFSTSSFMVDMHFCCDKLVNFSILGKAKVCNEEVDKKSNKECTTLQEKDCCSNQTIVKDADDTFNKTTTTLDSETLFFISTYSNSYANILFYEFTEDENSFQTYRPPLLSIDVIILNERFLI